MRRSAVLAAASIGLLLLAGLFCSGPGYYIAILAYMLHALSFYVLFKGIEQDDELLVAIISRVLNIASIIALLVAALYIVGWGFHLTVIAYVMQSIAWVLLADEKDDW